MKSLREQIFPKESSESKSKDFSAGAREDFFSEGEGESQQLGGKRVSTKSVAGVCLGLMVVYALICYQFDRMDGPLIDYKSRTAKSQKKDKTSGKEVDKFFAETPQENRPSVERFRSEQGFFESWFCGANRRSSFCK